MLDEGIYLDRHTGIEGFHEQVQPLFDSIGARLILEPPKIIKNDYTGKKESEVIRFETEKYGIVYVTTYEAEVDKGVLIYSEHLLESENSLKIDVKKGRENNFWKLDRFEVSDENGLVRFFNGHTDYYNAESIDAGKKLMSTEYPTSIDFAKCSISADDVVQNNGPSDISSIRASSELAARCLSGQKTI